MNDKIPNKNSWWWTFTSTAKRIEDTLAREGQALKRSTHHSEREINPKRHIKSDLRIHEIWINKVMQYLLKFIIHHQLTPQILKWMKYHKYKRVIIISEFQETQVTSKQIRKLIKDMSEKFNKELHILRTKHTYINGIMFSNKKHGIWSFAAIGMDVEILC